MLCSKGSSFEWPSRVVSPSGETQQRPCKVELPRGQGGCQGGVVTAVSTARWLPATMFLLRMLPLQTPPRGEAQPNGAVGPVPHRAGQLGVRGPPRGGAESAGLCVARAAGASL